MILVTVTIIWKWKTIFMVTVASAAMQWRLRETTCRTLSGSAVHLHPVVSPPVTACRVNFLLYFRSVAAKCGLSYIFKHLFFGVRKLLFLECEIQMVTVKVSKLTFNNYCRVITSQFFYKRENVWQQSRHVQGIVIHCNRIKENTETGKMCNKSLKEV